MLDCPFPFPTQNLLRLHKAFFFPFFHTEVTSKFPAPWAERRFFANIKVRCHVLNQGSEHTQAKDLRVFPR